MIGSFSEPPKTAEAVRLLLRAGVKVVINALTLSLPERRPLFAVPLPTIQALRTWSGWPHWLVEDEGHHTLSVVAQQLSEHLSHGLPATNLITVDPAWLAQEVLQNIDVIPGFGTGAVQAMTHCGQAACYAAERDSTAPAR